MPYIDDRELVDQTLQGDCEAFSRLIGRYRYAVYGICLSLVGDFDLAEDMAQEAFIKAYLHLNRLNAPARFGNWLRIIAVNECRLYLRRAHPDFVPVSRIHEAEAAPSEHLLPADQQRDVREQRVGRERLETAALQALGGLPEGNRQALTLYYLGGYTTEEVAGFLGISGPAAKMRLHRARKQLRKEAFKMVRTTLAGKELSPDFEDRIRPVDATVLFTDLAEFSTLFEILPAEDLIALLNAYLSDMTEIILRCGGTVDKYEGDAIIAFWGAPDPSDDHAVRGCLAALDMEDRLAEWRREGKPDLSVRYGLNTGRILVGDMGSRQLRDYTILGHDVNLAARFERANRQYGTRILISESTRKAAGDAIEVRELDRVRAPRREAPVTIYEVLARKGELEVKVAEVVGIFSQGLARYRERDWKGAQTAFDEALRAHPEDGPSRAFKARCEAFMAEAPEWLTEDWDGAIEV